MIPNQRQRASRLQSFVNSRCFPLVILALCSFLVMVISHGQSVLLNWVVDEYVEWIDVVIIAINIAPFPLFRIVRCYVDSDLVASLLYSLPIVIVTIYSLKRNNI